MSEHRALQKQLREFVFLEICEQLRSKEVYHLAYTQSLPTPFLSKTVGAVEVLLKLETEDKFSISNLVPLAEMMKVIGRKDLAKKVEKYINKKQKQSKHCKKAKDLPTSTVDPGCDMMLKACQVLASLKAAKKQVKILSEQIKEVHDTVREAGFRGLEDNVADTISLIEKQLEYQLDLSLETAARHMRHMSTESSLPEECFSGHSSLTSTSSDDGRSPIGTLERPPTRSRLAAMSKTMSLPRDFMAKRAHSQAAPLTEDPDEHDYEVVPAYIYHQESLRVPPAAGGSLYYDSADVVPQSIRDESSGRLVVGRDGAAKPKQKPLIALKPPKKQVVSASSRQRDQTAEYTGGSHDTSTGDSGFVDATKYRKEQPPPRVHPRHQYTPLKAEQREMATYYAKTNCPSKAQVYDEVHRAADKESPYVNFPILKRANSN